jgi:thiamine-phosphate pyrophosphorylase
VKKKFDPSLYLVVGSGFTGGRTLTDVVAQAVAGGATMVQLREKGLGERDLLALALALKRTLQPSGVPLIINDSVEVARRAGAEGVHLGQSDLACTDARCLLGPDSIIGLSVETMEQALEAEKFELDYLGVSPVFPSATKTDTGTPWGLEGLSRLRRVSRHLLVGIGKITPENAGEVIRAGADGVAVVSAICRAASPRATSQALRIAVTQALGDSDFRGKPLALAAKARLGQQREK